MDYLSNNVAVNLKRFRQYSGMSLDQMAERTEVSKSMLAQIERGQANPSIGVLCKITVGLQIEFEDLIQTPKVTDSPERSTPGARPSIKAVIFDIDNTLYSYDKNHIYGMKALTDYCESAFGKSAEETLACYKKAGQIMIDRIGGDVAAIHNRLLRTQGMLELWEKPVFPHARNMYHAYWDTLIRQSQPVPGVIDFLKELKKRGVRTGTGTDMTAYIQYKKLESSVLHHILILWSAAKRPALRNHIHTFLRSAWKNPAYRQLSVHLSVIIIRKMWKVHATVVCAASGTRRNRNRNMKQTIQSYDHLQKLILIIS